MFAGMYETFKIVRKRINCNILDKMYLTTHNFL